MIERENRARASVALSRDELSVVMRLLKAPWIPGSAPVDVEQPLDLQQTSVAVAAERALAARGFLNVTAPVTPDAQRQVNMDPLVVALVGACALSSYDLCLSLRRAQPPRITHFHQLGEVGVMHTMPELDIHQFEMLPGREGVLSAATELLGLKTQTATPLADGVLAAPKLRQIHTRPAGTPPATIAHMLREGGLSAPLAEAVTAALTMALSTGVVMAFRPSAGPTAGVTLSVIVAPDACFTMTLTPDAAHYAVRPASAEAIRTWISAQLPA